jgi:hypothetical protein
MAGGRRSFRCTRSNRPARGATLRVHGQTIIGRFGDRWYRHPEFLICCSYAESDDTYERTLALKRLSI